MLGSENSESNKATRHGRLTPGEDTRFSAPPTDGAEHETDWENDLRLNHLLSRLPDAPVFSNFTARVLSQAEQVVRTRKQHPWLARWNWFAEALPSLGWAPQLAAGAAVVAVALFSFIQYRASARQEVARSVVAVSNVAALPSLDVLVNFEAIQRLPEVPKDRTVDVELLAALR